MSIARVLVVEDDASIRRVVELVLSEEGYAVDTAPNGLAGLCCAVAQTPDVILLDLYMDLMDGWAFACAYRDMQVPHAPIVVMSGHPQAPANAAAFLPKPFGIKELTETVRRLLPLAA